MLITNQTVKFKKTKICTNRINKTFKTWEDFVGEAIKAGTFISHQYTLGGEFDIDNTYKLHVHVHLIPAIPLEIEPKVSFTIEKYICTKFFIATLFIIANTRNDINAHK